MSEEKFKVYKDVFDRGTIKAIFDLIAKKVIEGIESPIKIGKESNVFSGIRIVKSKDGEKKERVAIKIYRIAACDFKKMKKYLIIDPRYKVGASRRKIVLQWAKREFGNLKKAYENNVRVPKPIAINENVLVMEFIGNKNPYENPLPFPLLKDFELKDPKNFFIKLIKEIRKLYLNANLVHSDLSEFNILVSKREEPIIIDLSHALPRKFTGHFLYLRRDISNIARFFSKKIGLKKEKLENEIESYLTGKKENMEIK